MLELKTEKYLGLFHDTLVAFLTKQNLDTGWVYYFIAYASTIIIIINNTKNFKSVCL